jgi:CRISPR-associated protein Cas2
MILVCYDIHNNKNRTKLSKFLEKHGRRLQFSVWEIDQHYTIEDLIKKTISTEFRQRLKGNDSIMIVPLLPSNQSLIIRYGKTIQEQEEFLIFGV